MAWSPGEYGTDTSTSIFSKYCLRLLKRRPPRDMSSQTTTSSAEPARRTQALKLTRMRACFRRFSCSFVATPAADAAAAGAPFVISSTAGLGGVTGAKVGAGTCLCDCIQAGSANADRSGATGASDPSPDGTLPGTGSFQSVDDPHFWQYRTMLSLTAITSDARSLWSAICRV